MIRSLRRMECTFPSRTLSINGFIERRVNGQIKCEPEIRRRTVYGLKLLRWRVPVAVFYMSYRGAKPIGLAASAHWEFLGIPHIVPPQIYWRWVVGSIVTILDFEKDPCNILQIDLNFSLDYRLLPWSSQPLVKSENLWVLKRSQSCWSFACAVHLVARQYKS